jgi:hypothetical protein
MQKEENETPFVNPIDKDKITENPGFLPYAHTVGSAVIKPEDRGKLKSRALTAMEQQTGKQLKQIHEQMELLAKQAGLLKKRVEISHDIYHAEMGFEPFVGHTYYLYQRPNLKRVIMMISPEEWNPKELNYVATINLMADHTWDVIHWEEKNNQE